MTLLRQKEIMTEFSMIFQAQGLKLCQSCQTIIMTFLYYSKMLEVRCVRKYQERM